jgi:CubicO group peptidase (beta-lactamase class C family)
MNKLLIGLFIAGQVLTAQAQSDLAFSNGGVSPYYMTGRLADGYVPITRFAAKKPQPLAYRTMDERTQALAGPGEAIFDDDSSALAQIMVARGEIHSEKYSRGTDKSTKFFSWSMAKSVTGMIVGEALCSGKIDSLDDRADRYAPNLKGTQWGQATIKQILSMSSGAKSAGPDGEYGDGWFALTRGFKSHDDYFKQMGEVTNLEGTFNYNNYDTNSLVYILGDNFRPLFEAILARAGTTDEVVWMTDKRGQINGAYGISATLQDWAKLANETIDMRTGRRGKCLQAYMMDSTRRQASNNYQSIKGLKSYGYQTWLDNRTDKGIYIWIGAFGQKTFINPEDETVMITFRSHFKQDMTDRQFVFFRKWQPNTNNSTSTTRTAAVQGSEPGGTR